MKVAFAIDFLITRTQEVFLLELLLQGFEDAEIYTLAHAQGKILGRIETHRIHSSPLSKMIQTEADLTEKAWMLPGAAKQLTVASDVDKLIIISSGWAHTIASGPKTERHVWMFDYAQKKVELKGWRRWFFRFHHEDFKHKALEREKHRSFANAFLEKVTGHEGAPIIHPGFKTDDYPLVPEDQHNGEYPYHLVLLEGADPKEVREVFKLAKAAGVQVKCLGPDAAYESDKKTETHVEFIGDHCSATTGALSHWARAVWILKDTAFPAEAFGAMCCGRPAVVKDTVINRELLPKEGAWFVTTIAETFAIANRDFLSPDRRVLRRFGLKHNERLFKNQIRSWAGVRPSKSEE